MDLDQLKPEVIATEEHRKATILSNEFLSNDFGGSAPLVIVGLPRSGSSLIADLLSQSSPYYIFDDLYYHEKAKNQGYIGALTPMQLEESLFFLGWQIRARIRFKHYSVPQMPQDDVVGMNDAIKVSIGSHLITWDGLQKEWLVRLALLNKKMKWGYNFPKGFLYKEEIINVYPNAKFLFLFRRPEAVFASYKYMEKDHRDGHPDQFHIVAYSLYWRASVRAYLELKKQCPEAVKKILFEDLILSTDKVLSDIAQFFGYDIIPGAEKKGANSSFKLKRKEITGLEKRILLFIARKEMESMGYTVKETGIKLLDFIDLAGSTWRFLRFRFFYKRKK